MRYAVGRWAQDRWNRDYGRMFSVGGRSTNTAAAANECLCNLWNDHTSRSLWVAEFSYSSTADATTDPLRFCRTTTTGNVPSVTINPDADNDYARESVPNGGAATAVLYLGNFDTEPVLQTPELYRLNFPTTGVRHTMTWVFPRTIKVPPLTGLALATTGAIGKQAADITFRFED